MPISNAQFDAIMRSYEERRLANRHLLTERKQEVYDLIPEYAALDAELGNMSVEQGRKLIHGDQEALKVLREQIRLITEKKEKLMTEYGFPADYLEEIYTCRDCRDTGYIDGKKCKCLKQAILRVLYAQSNIEQVLSEENFDNLSYEYYNDSDVEKMRQIIGECRDFADRFDKTYENLLLCGSVGVGKTYLTNCIAAKLLNSGHSVIYFTSFKLFELLGKCSFRPDEADEDIMALHEDIFDCDLLIIDDLGTEITNSFVASELFKILNERHLRKRSTIISTNLSLAALNEKYTERNFSRIFGFYNMIRINIDDIRVKMKRIQNAQDR
ncbi:MAG: ATP-binding protein [Lachnospiraceae bacterium]|nr:ATP-binding protein [Lachnospiraceae bacterium]